MSFVSPDDDRRPGYVRDFDEAASERASRLYHDLQLIRRLEEDPEFRREYERALSDEAEGANE